MVPSFLIFAIIVIIRIIAESLLDKFSFIAKYIPYFNYACIGGAVLFALFVLAKLIATLFSGKKR